MLVRGTHRTEPPWPGSDSLCFSQGICPWTDASATLPGQPHTWAGPWPVAHSGFREWLETTKGTDNTARRSPRQPAIGPLWALTCLTLGSEEGWLLRSWRTSAWLGSSHRAELGPKDFGESQHHPFPHRNSWLQVARRAVTQVGSGHAPTAPSFHSCSRATLLCPLPTHPNDSLPSLQMDLRFPSPRGE